MRKGLLRYLPGLAMAAAIGAPALILQSRLTVSGKTVVSAVAVAIVLGVLIRNLWGLAEAWPRCRGVCLQGPDLLWTSCLAWR